MSKKDIVVSCLTFLCAFALVGCASVHVDRVGTFDFSEKTICVPPGYGLALGPVKRGLRASGWKIFSIAKGKDVTVKDGGSVANNGNEQERMETEWDARARYRMLFWSAQVDVDLMFHPISSCRFSIIAQARRYYVSAEHDARRMRLLMNCGNSFRIRCRGWLLLWAQKVIRILRCGRNQ